MSGKYMKIPDYVISSIEDIVVIVKSLPNETTCKCTANVVTDWLETTKTKDQIKDVQV